MGNPTVQILPFATGLGSLVDDPVSNWPTNPARLTGFQNGIVLPQDGNTAWRQPAFVSAMIAQFMADFTGRDVLDNGDLVGFETQFEAALRSFIGAISGPLTPYTMSVISAQVITPPPLPFLGDTYLIPSSATGVWAGYVNFLTQWNGENWVFANMPQNGIVIIGDTADIWVRVSTGWRSKFATNAEALAGTSKTLLVNPNDLMWAINQSSQKTTASSWPPANPNLGDNWMDTDLMVEFRWVTDGVSSFWLQHTL